MNLVAIVGHMILELERVSPSSNKNEKSSWGANGKDVEKK